MNQTTADERRERCFAATEQAKARRQADDALAYDMLTEFAELGIDQPRSWVDWWLLAHQVGVDPIAAPRSDIALAYITWAMRERCAAHIRENVAKQGVGIAADFGTLEAMPGDAMLTHIEIAEKLNLPRESLRKRLERWRKKNLDGCQQIATEQPRAPHYLYKISAVRSVLREAISSAQRPAK